MSSLKDVNRITSDMEGIVFKHNNKLYKFTGTFAPVNQILGLAGFDIKDEIVKQAEDQVRKEKKEDKKDLISEILKKIQEGCRNKNPRSLYVDDILDMDMNKISLMSEFCNFCADTLPLENGFKIYVVSERKPYNISTTAHYKPNDHVITVKYIKSYLHKKQTEIMSNQKASTKYSTLKLLYTAMRNATKYINNTLYIYMCI